MKRKFKYRIRTAAMLFFYTTHRFIIISDSYLPKIYRYTKFQDIILRGDNNAATLVSLKFSRLISSVVRNLSDGTLNY
jgi:hypothetical protein